MIKAVGAHLSGGDRFQVLPADEVDATDEALYVNTDLLEEREDDVAVLVEELQHRSEYYAGVRTS